MDAPSTDSVTVLCAETAYPPAKVNVSSVAAKTPRSMGERASSSLFNAFKVSIPTNLISRREPQPPTASVTER